MDGLDELKRITIRNEVKIIRCLKEKEKTWDELLRETNFSRMTLSKHLKRLIEKEIIKEEISKKDRRRKIYRLNEAKKDEIEGLINSYIEFTLKHVKEVLKEISDL